VHIAWFLEQLRTASRLFVLGAVSSSYLNAIQPSSIF
jgi:hypothetical protein